MTGRAKMKRRRRRGQARSAAATSRRSSRRPRPCSRKKASTAPAPRQIARLAGVPKPNLHYYFRTKQALYEAVLDHVLGMWVDAMEELHPGADPADALSRYVARKIDLSRRLPGASRLWAMEMLAGAPHIGGFLRGRVRELVAEKSALVETWIEAGRIAPIDAGASVFRDLGRDPDLRRFRRADDCGHEPQVARRRFLRRRARHADDADRQRAWTEALTATSALLPDG